MKTLAELLEERDSIVTSMETLISKADEEKRDFTEEEEKEFTDFDTSLNGIKEEIRKKEEVELRKAKLAEERTELDKVDKLKIPDGEVRVGRELALDKPFGTLGEFFATVRSSADGAPVDIRLKEMRVQQMKNGTSGGYMIPDQFQEGLLSVTPQEAIVRPRAMVIPAGSPPDAEIKINTLDQTSGQNMYGGVAINHDGESDTITETNAVIKQVSLKPKRISAFMTASDELMNNWAAADTFIREQMRLAVIGAEDTDFLTGDGVNKSLGITNAPAKIEVTRAGANAIAYADITGMYARMLFRGSSLVWVTSQTTIPQLTTIADAGSNNLWVQSAAANIPPTLLGIPVLFNERSPALGSTGDLMLCDFSKYLIKDGSGPFVAFSEHFRFQNNEGAFRITWRVDGQSWLSEAIPLEGSTSNTVSPFVILA